MEASEAHRYLPRIRELYRRHPGLTQALSCSYEEAAAVSLSRVHQPPTSFAVSASGRIASSYVQWNSPTDREVRAWANATDRVEAAAYGVSLAAIEAEMDLFAIARARTLSGCDYYVAPAGNDDYLENAIRVEISGTESSIRGRISERVSRKAKQVHRQGERSLVCVVSFGSLGIVLRSS